MGIKLFLRRIWLISANKIKTSESVCKESSQLKLELNSSLRQIIDTLVCTIYYVKWQVLSVQWNNFQSYELPQKRKSNQVEMRLHKNFEQFIAQIHTPRCRISLMNAY